MCGDFDDFFDDIELEDFTIIGGIFGFIEEQAEEEERSRRENEGEIPDEAP